MSAENEVVETIFNIATRIMLEGTELGLKIAGSGAKAIGVSFFALARKIMEKERTGKKLTPGEIAFKDLMNSGEEIHSVWLNTDELSNFTKIAKQMGVPFVAIKNGDELAKTHKLFTKRDNDGNVVEFVDDYKDKVSISFRASDDVRLSHIIEMFSTFNHSTTIVNDNQKEIEKIKDEVEEFIKDNGVEIEYPPEVIVAEEVRKNNAPVFEKNSLDLNKEQSQQISYGSEILCFSEFGFSTIPNKEDFKEAFDKYLLDNPDKKEFATALFEQGNILIDKGIVDNKSKSAFVVTNADDTFKFFGLDKKPTLTKLKKSYERLISKRTPTAKKKIVSRMYEYALNVVENHHKDNNIYFCYQLFGFDRKPTKSELTNAYNNFDFEKFDFKAFCDNAYKKSLNQLEKSNSVRTKLQVKKELNEIKSKTNIDNIKSHIKNQDITK